MSKITALVLLACLLCGSVFSQELNIPAPKYARTDWKAGWIAHPGLNGQEHAVVLFRRNFDLTEKPAQFIVSISADNHYTLYVNGQKVCFGPQLSDIRHWRYETVDLAPYLSAGANTLAVEVINWGYHRFFGMQSVHTALVINGFSEKENIVNTEWRSGAWKTFRNIGVREKPVRWRVADPDIIGGFYACNPTDSLVAADYPWGWEQRGFDDRHWSAAVFCENASAFGGGFGWLLEPRNVPLQRQETERLTKIARSDGIAAPEGFLQGRQALEVPARSKASLLIDQTFLTIGIPELHFSGGKGASIKITYAENLFNADKSKGNRNEIAGKRVVGYGDVVLPDGGAKRVFRPTWLRAFRFILLEIQTADEPLTLRDFYNVLTTTSIQPRAAFQCDNPVYSAIFDICRRTALLCTQDYFLSDAYYETMQYVGDSKVHILTWQAMTGNELHTRNALQQFHYSRLPDGNLTSCYPLKSTFVHPTYSVIWVDMLWDYLLYSGDKDYIRPFLPGIRHTLDGFDALIQPNGLAGPTRWDYFVDWYVEASRGGTAPGSNQGNSAVVTLHYVYALQNAARIYDVFDLKADAQRCRLRAETIKKKVYAACFDPKRGILAERPDHTFHDQHSNIMAVLTDAIPTARQPELLRKILTEPGISPATYYYRFYLFEALRKARAGDLFPAAIAPWEELLRRGLTTTIERFEEGKKSGRSEAHPWSTSPLYAFYTVLAGIEPLGPGFEQVRIAPRFSNLNTLEGLYPTPKGDIRFKMTRSGTQGLNALITLPPGMRAVVEWRGKKMPVRGTGAAVEVRF
jgi:alpha-L-rhamnosidase